MESRELITNLEQSVDNCWHTIRPDQINLLLQRFAGPIFILPKINSHAHAQLATLYLEAMTLATWSSKAVLKMTGRPAPNV